MNRHPLPSPDPTPSGSAALPDTPDEARGDLPLLDEVPELARLLELIAEIDRLSAQAVGLVALLQDTGLAETATGLPVELWLSARGRRTRSDRRMLAAAADMATRLPGTYAAFRAGKISWSQYRAVVLACLRLPGHVVGRVDDAIVAALDGLADAEPDALVNLVSQAATSLEPRAAQAEVDQAEARQFVHLQPRLDGTGGRLFGELAGPGFALVADALDPGPPPGPSRAGLGHSPDPEVVVDQRHDRGRRRAQRLIDLCAHALTDDPDDDRRDDGAGGGGVPPVAPRVLLTMNLEQLLGLSDAPAEILTTATGGRMRLSTAAARRWIDRCGARFRGIVIEDTGAVLGVGRARYRPPGWLRDALLARDATCTGPGCQVSATLAHADHARDWQHGGTTDTANLGWLHPGCHTNKAGWQAIGHPDGTRTWIHPRTGLTIQHVPTARKLHLPPPGSRPPGPQRPNVAARPEPRAGTEAGAEPPPGPRPRAGPDPPARDTGTSGHAPRDLPPGDDDTGWPF